MRSAQCPNCGGPVEFKLASSAAVVCSYCRFAVVRTDRDLSAIGKVADLVPTAAEATVGDGGTIEGAGFKVVGRVQLDHGKGPWDEWYLGFDDGRWAWLAKAQGEWYVTSPVEGAGPFPPWSQMYPGLTGQIPGSDVAWTTAERGASRVVSAEGELPYPTRSGDQGHYVDLYGPGDRFATMDYGDGTEPARFFAGRRIPHAALVWTVRSAGPRPEEKLTAKKLACPNCGGPVDIFVPSETERAACQSCSALLDVSKGALSFLGQLKQPRVTPTIPIGTTGTLRGVECLCIGYMQRSTHVEGEYFSWREYLMHTPQGYRWVMEDSGQYHFVGGVNPADVQLRHGYAFYQNRRYRRFSSVIASVEFVAGEFYWKVQQGEQAHASDFIAPPFLLSEETSANEAIWSAGEWIPAAEIWKAFRLQGRAPTSSTVGAAQPSPVIWPTMVAGLVLLLGFAGVTMALDWNRSSDILVDGDLQMPPQSLAALAAVPVDPNAIPPDTAMYTPTFDILSGPTTLGVHLRTTADNQWVGVNCALINETTGAVREFSVETEYWHGYTDGESWTEGSKDATVYVDAVPAGRYSMRFEPSWENQALSFIVGGPPAPQARLRVNTRERSSLCCCGAFILLLVPIPFSLIRRARFERKRWSNSNLNTVWNQQINVGSGSDWDE